MKYGRLAFAALMVSAAVYGVTALAQVGGETGPLSGVPDPTPGPNKPMSQPPIGGATDIIRSPRFKVEVMGISAVDETGTDWWSDEIFAVYDNQQHRIVTSVHENIDSGDVILIPAWERCLLPTIADGRGWKCLAEGAAAPLHFAVSVWEQDGVNWLAEFCTHRVEVMPAGARVLCADFNTLLFSLTFAHEEAELLQKLRVPGTHFDVERGWVGFEWAWGFEYHVRLRITRVADHIEERPRELEH